jgi:hypothetical protein
MAVSNIDTRPDTVNLSGYAGDTMVIRVLVEGDFVKSMDWLAQVKQSRQQGDASAEFTVVPFDGGATLTLSAAETARLAGVGAVVQQDGNPQPYDERTVRRFTGEWDVQVSSGGSDPVVTLVQGALTIDLDVSRAV